MKQAESVVAQQQLQPAELSDAELAVVGGGIRDVTDTGGRVGN